MTVTASVYNAHIHVPPSVVDYAAVHTQSPSHSRTTQSVWHSVWLCGAVGVCVTATVSLSKHSDTVTVTDNPHRRDTVRDCCVTQYDTL